MTVPLDAVENGVRISVRLTPGAARDAVQGLQQDAEGVTFLKASVTAPPEGGKANAAMVKLLSKSWRLPKTSISVIRGETDRRKLLHIEGDPAALLLQLRAWLTERGDAP